MITPVKRIRKLVKIDVDETSGVENPAHGAGGWVVRKDAGPAPLPLGARKLSESDKDLIQHILDELKNGEAVEFTEIGTGGAVGKSRDGTAFIITAQSIAKAKDLKDAENIGNEQT